MHQQLGVGKLFEGMLLKFALNIASHGPFDDGGANPILVESQPLLGQCLIEQLDYTINVDFFFDDSYTFFCHNNMNLKGCIVTTMCVDNCSMLVRKKPR